MKKPWKPDRLDIFISLVMTLLFPLLASLLLDVSGALIPMILYYGSAWGISIWRRGSTGYHLRNLKRPPLSFYIHVVIIVIILILAYFSRIIVLEPVVLGIILTALLWTVANASSEQLLWIYIFDTWDLYGRDHFQRRGRIIMRIMGLLMFTIFVGTIHTMYWAKFLHTVNPELTIGMIFIIGTSISGYLHIIVWRKSSEMLYTFIPHYLLNLFPLFWTGYSILPYLLNHGI